MKRHKLFMTIFAVVAIAGSVLAFNTASRGTTQLYGPNPNNPEICDQPNPECLYKPGPSPIIATTIQGNSCTTLFSTCLE